MPGGRAGLDCLALLLGLDAERHPVPDFPPWQASGPLHYLGSARPARERFIQPQSMLPLGKEGGHPLITRKTANERHAGECMALVVRVRRPRQRPADLGSPSRPNIK